MNIIESNIIYENPLPQLESKQSFFPFLCQLKSGALAAVIVIGQAFESVDSTSCITFSYDSGKTWSKPKPIFSSEETVDSLVILFIKFNLSISCYRLCLLT